MNNRKTTTQGKLAQAMLTEDEVTITKNDGSKCKGKPIYAESSPSGVEWTIRSGDRNGPEEKVFIDDISSVSNSDS